MDRNGKRTLFNEKSFITVKLLIFPLVFIFENFFHISASIIHRRSYKLFFLSTLYTEYKVTNSLDADVN